MYLFDTNIISELRKIKNNRADKNVLNWVNAQNHTQFYTSKIVIMELRIGALLRQQKDPTQSHNLQNWITNNVIPSFGERILAIDDNILEICATLHVPNPRSQHDALIASTAIAYNLILVTRNLDDFVNMPVQLINPFTSP